MTLFYNALGMQNVGGSSLQDRYYAFTYDGNFDHILADATVAAFVWATGIKSSATANFTVSASDVQTSSDFFNGLENTDIVYGSNGRDAILYNNGTASGGIGSFASIEQFYLGAGDDIIDLSLHGATGIDYARNVLIHGDNGNDTIIAGAGADTIYGDDGDDLIFGYRGADVVYGGAGADTVYGDDLGFNAIAGDDTLYGQGGDDILYGGARTDRLEGGDGNDTLYGGLGGDTLFGGAGADILHGDDAGSSGNDQLNGDAGNDQLFGGLGNDELRGGTGDDAIMGGDGTDFLSGDAGSDTLTGGAGNDTIDGAADADTAIYSGNFADYGLVFNTDGSITITDLRAGTPDGSDTTRNVEFYKFADQVVSFGQLNQPPVITSDGGGATASLTVAENTTAVTTVVATDPDTGQTVSYSISGGADAARLQIDAKTGTLAFVTAPNFENPTDAGGDNQYDVVVRATDSSGGFDEQALAITVSDVVDGAPPLITSNGGGASASVKIDENTTTVTTVVADDPDGPTLTYAIAGGADAAKFAIDALTGALAFIAAPDFEAPADANHDNTYVVTVQASDGDNIDLQTISVSVANVNDAAPVITSAGGGSAASITIAENQAMVATVTSTDPDGPTPTYAIVGGTDADLFSIDAQTGALAFTTAPDFEAPADADHDNVYAVTVQASDGVNTDQQDISVTISNVNDSSPVITSGGGGASASVKAAENQTAVTAITATDADGTTPTFAISGGADAALFSLDAQTGALSFISAPDFENPQDADDDGVYEITVRATDGTSFDDQQVSVTVTDLPDNPPVISSNGGGATAAVSIGENGVAVTTVVASDPDGTTPTYLIAGGADAALFSIDGTSGVLVFKAAPDFETSLDADHDGIYEVVVRATDGVYYDDQKLSVTVTDLPEGGKMITGTSGNNTISPTATNAAFVTTSLNDTIFGMAGNDIIDGGLGADRMEGGLGNDTFYVDAFTDDGNAANDDLVIEQLNEGTDLVNSSVGYVLAAHVENLTLTGIAAIYGTGNDLANVITGNDAANVLNGAAGADTLDGKGGNDTILGGAGDDRLDGGADADILNGGADNDAYFVDTFSDDGIAANDDQVVELAGGGTDIVNASISYILADEVENLTLTGGGAIAGTGNTLANTITGNAGANSLAGLDGNDVINGNAGADTLLGGNGNDTLNGGNDADSLYGEAGTDTILGAAGDDLLDGGAGTDTLSGQSGSDIVIGGTGKDTLTGGSEADTFRFSFGDTTILSSSYDTVTDFVTGVDKIDLDSVADALNPAAYVEGTIATNLFADALNSARSILTAGKEVAFVAGTTDGWLFWDANHDGAIDQSLFLKSLGSLNAFYSGDVI